MNPAWQEIDALLDRLERLGDPAVREDARALVARLMRLHGEALARLVEIARTAGGPGLLDAWKDDPQVGGLLLLHGLHPDDLASRVRGALAEIAPVAAFLGVEVRPRLLGEEVVLDLRACLDVTAPAVAELRRRLEEAILSRAPEVRAVAFEGIAPARRLELPLLGGGRAAP